MNSDHGLNIKSMDDPWLSKIIGGNSTEVGGQVGGPMKFKLVEKLVDQR